MVEEVDILICGSGSAGLCAAAYLARCGISCKIIESRDGPLKLGQADGVQCRTVEMFESFGLAQNLLNEAYHVVEDVFWSRNEEGQLVRTKTAADTAKGISHLPHLILNQARLHDFLIDAMSRWNGQTIEYGRKVLDVKVDSEAAARDPNSYAVSVTTVKNGKEESIRARYALGCDGAHSIVRKSLGFKMLGDSTDAVWGVMDVYPQTDFPDIRKKGILRTQEGSLLIIPREGNSLVRLYIELAEGTVAKEVRVEDLQTTARRIFHPYKMDIVETFWWSAYSIGQRHADFFSKDNRVFLTGDACHTHSPKAGQGMNTSLQDGYNIGWKLASIIKGQASSSLLRTYNIERERVAIDLIEFDREFAQAFASRSKVDFSEYFIKSGRYTAGMTKRYDQSEIINISGSNQDLAKGLDVGMRFPSTQVVRFCDAKPVQLSQVLQADGRWRIVVFPGDVQNPAVMDNLKKLGNYLDSADGPVRRFTPAREDIDSFIETIVIFSGHRLAAEQDQIPGYFWPATGRWKMRDLHKTFVDEESYNNGHGHGYEFWGVDKNVGALVIVRPDQYVSMVCGISDYKGIGKFFGGFSITPKSSSEPECMGSPGKGSGSRL